MKAVKVALLVLMFQSTFLQAQVDTTKMFIFGHSLIDHRPPTPPTPSNETTVPHWIYLLAEEANLGYAASGQYGFLPQHANLPPFSQWGYDIVPPVWESDYDPFSDADFTTILITAGNFMQWQAPNLEYPGDPGVTPINATEDIVDWLVLQEDSLKIYIYENWPDMAPYLPNGFPPSAADFANYNSYTLGDFHNWWIEYQDSLLLSRPNVNIRMIPTGPIMAEMFIDTVLNQVPLTELYEDDAPHGRASLYFLAGLITYMAIYEQPAPLNYNVPSIVHPIIQNNYEAIVNQAWSKLQDFNDLMGNSRVFCDNLSSNTDVDLKLDNLTLYPNPTSGFFQIRGMTGEYNIEILNADGSLFQNLNTSNPSLLIDISTLPMGLYFIKVENVTTGTLSLEKILLSN